MRFLKAFAAGVPRGFSTHDVVHEIIKPATVSVHCRYVALLDEADVGPAFAFASHTWRAPFHDLVSALAHVLEDHQFVWVDIFAVLQSTYDQLLSAPNGDQLKAEKIEDLDFATVVQGSKVFILVGSHVPEVEFLSSEEAGRFIVPEEAKMRSAFFRVWCLVEMEAALQAGHPVIMLVGGEKRPMQHRIRHTSMLGGALRRRNGAVAPRGGSAAPRLVEWPPQDELQSMSRAELEAFHFTHVGMKARGGLDGLQFWDSRGRASPFYGACPSLNQTASRFGDVRGEMHRQSLGDGNVRAIDVFWYEHDVTGLAFIGEGGRVLAQEGPGSCRDGFGQQRVELAPSEKLVGFKFFTDHCTPRISFLVADLGQAHLPETPVAVTELAFEPNKGMLMNLFELMDVQQAVASHDDDRMRILNSIETTVGFAAVNTLGRGAVMGAMHCMDEREVLQAAAGNTAPLAALQGKRALTMALCAAAAGGLNTPLQELLRRKGEVEVGAVNAQGRTPIALAAAGGHATTLQMLIDAGAEVNPNLGAAGTLGGPEVNLGTVGIGGPKVPKVKQLTPLMYAADGGHLSAVKVLLAARAEVNKRSNDSESALYLAQKSEHEEVVKVLIQAGATGSDDILEKLLLVPQNDPRCLMLANATTIGQGQQAPLTLAAPLQDHAVCRAFEERRVAFGEWKYTALAIGPAAQAVTCALIDGKLVEGATQGVVTPSMLNLHQDNHFDFVWGPDHPKVLHKEAAKKGNALDLIVHPNGSVSATAAPHLFLGREGQARPDCWNDDPPGFSTEGGAWAKFYNVDMSHQGDKQIVHGWKKTHTIQMLKREVEQKGYSGFTVCYKPNFQHAALKSFDFQLLPEHCRPISESHRNPCAIYIYTPPQSKAKPPGGPKPKLVLMKAMDERRCVFEHAATLKSGGEAPLTLTSHPGLAVMDMWSPDRQAGEWTYVELAIGDASAAQRFRRKGNFLVRPDGKVLDVAMWRHEEGNHLVAVIHTAGQAKQTFKGGGGRDFVINGDGTISPKHASQLVVGLEFAPWKTAKQPNASVQRASQRDLLASAKGGPSCEECEA